MYLISEIVGLTMAVILAPLTYAGFRDSRLAGKPWFFGGYVAMMLAYLFVVAGHYGQPEIFKQLEHVCYALSGLGFMAGSWTIVVRERGWLT
jgi:hypothetical protein